MTPEQLDARMPTAALAFRGYNVQNLGRSRELLLHADYGEIVAKHLRSGSRAAHEATGRPIDLVDRVRRGEETSLESYVDAVALIVAMEIAQLEILRDAFGVDYRQARLSLGFSLGEITALVAGGVFELEEALRVPLGLADDCVALAHDVTLAVLFSRGRELPLKDVQRLCLTVNLAGRGTLGPSAVLSPNSMLLMGQGDALDRFALAMPELLPGASLRRNANRWPPLHTPIVWQRQVSDRAAVLMQTLRGGFVAPTPPVLSLVTGKISYDEVNARELLHLWTYRPQLLWDAVYETLAAAVELVIHLGPEPNIVPATFQRLRDNVEVQTRHRIRMRALSAAVRRPWLKALLPQRTALLRAPMLVHLTLEDWLLDESLRQ